MLLNKVILILILSSVLIACRSTTQKAKLANPVVDSAYHKDSTRSQLPVIFDSLVNNGVIKAVFNKNSETVNVIYKINKKEITLKLGKYSNTFGDPPDISITKLNGNNIGFIIKTNYINLGWSMDNIYIYGFDIKTRSIKMLCEVNDINEHGAELDTLPEASTRFYNYSIDTLRQKLILNEYIPYKSLIDIAKKYKTITKEYPFIK